MNESIVSTPIVSAENLTTHYGKNHVFSGLTFDWNAGAVHGLIGGNGEGKTTLLRIVAGHMSYSGRIEVFGHDPCDNPAVLDHAVLVGIDAPFPSGWSVAKILSTAQSRWGTWRTDIEHDVIGRLHVPVHEHYEQLSRGQKSAVGIAVALASGCELVLLDEPYLGLDITAREEFFDLLAAHNDGTRTFVLSTHHVSEAEKVLDKVTLIDAGTVRLNTDVVTLSQRFVEVTGTTTMMATITAAGVTPISIREHAGMSSAIIDCEGLDHTRVADIDLYPLVRDSGAKATGASLERIIRTLRRN